MDSDEASVIEDYESSLEDLTFNSKPLINVLTMLAEENRKHAVVIVKLIQRRIIKVEQLQKLPALYLLDSIIKNVGREYLNLIAQIIDSVFTSVFEKADEKTRRDLHKLRNTWPQYFSAKILYDLDVKVKKLDPAWPIAVVPPPSPTIHINPKFLKKVEESSSSSPAEVVVRQDSVVQEQQSRLIQLQKLQEEQLALTEREIEEHKLKRELLLKKQMQERQLLIKQQQEQMLKLRLQADQKGLSSDSDTENSSVPSPMEVAEQSPSSTSFAVPESVDTLGKVVNSTPQTTTARDPRLRKNGPPMANDDKIRETEEELRHTKPKDIRNSERNAVQNDSNVLPVENLNDSVEPQVDSEQIKLKPGSERGMQLDYNHGRHERAKRPWVRRETNNKKVDGRDSRSKDMNRRKRERKRNRGRGFNRGGREQQDKARPDRNAQHFIQRHLEDQQERDFLASDRRKTLIEEPLMKKPKALFEHHEISEIRAHHSASHHIDPLRRDCPENHELNLLHREHFDPREQGHGHPPSHFRRNSPSRPVNLDIPPGRRKEMLRQEYEHHPPANRWHDNSDQWQFRPTFEIPQELTLDHKAEIMSQAERRLSTGDLSKEQHTDLMEKLEQFYELQKQQEKFQQMNFERQHLEPRHEPDDYGRSPQETFSHGDSRTVLPRSHMVLGDTGINDGPGQPRKHDGPFHPFEHPRFLPPVDYQGPFRPPGERHPDFSMDRHRHPVPMGRPRSGDHPGQRIEDLMEHDNPGQFVPFERTHRHLDEASRVHSMDKQGPNQDFGPGMDHHFHPLDHRGPFEPEGDHIRHGFPVEAMRDEPMSHGWPINPPEHWQHESGRLLGPIHDRGRSSPCMDIDVPREEILGNADISRPGFRPDLRRAPPVNQRTHQEMDMVPSSMGPVRPSQFEPGPSEQAVKPREDLRPNIVMPQTPPRDQMMPDTGKPFTPNTMLQKKSVDDLFQRLVSVGIIKVMPEQVQEPPTRSATPPQPPPPTTSVKSKLNENVTETKTEEDTKIPEIKLFPNELKKRHKAIIDKLCSGTQCSSCGLRFPGDVAVKYREHLDWHFRMNRREKDGRRVAHRQWYITFKDWLAYEEIGDPEERAHSSVFDVLKGIATTNSPDTTVATESNSNSTPVLDGDGEEESTCDICCEKFEQFWEESAEEWHYRDAVRVDGKTYHNLCYQDAKESHIEGGEDEEQDPGSPPPGNSKARDSRIASTEEKPNVKEINATENHKVKGEKDAVKQEASSLKDNSNVTEKGSSEECSSVLVKVETEVDNVGSGKIVTNKDANGQNNEK